MDLVVDVLGVVGSIVSRTSSSSNVQFSENKASKIANLPLHHSNIPTSKMLYLRVI